MIKHELIINCVCPECGGDLDVWRSKGYPYYVCSDCEFGYVQYPDEDYIQDEEGRNIP